MQVFISWSGNRSKAVAELLDEWIQCVLQAAKPWMSSKDIDRGSLWFSEISGQLKDTKIGIVCLTKDNLDKPWILFESGALAKGLSSTRVCTLLIDLEPTEVSNPLAQFNHTLPTRDGIYELVRTLNTSLEEKSLKERVLEQVFDTYWSQFEKSFSQILEENPAGEHLPPRSEESILSEVLHTIRTLDRRVRSIEKNNRGSQNIARLDEENERERSIAILRNEIVNMLKFGLTKVQIEETLTSNEITPLDRHIIKVLLKELADDDPSSSKV